jgi:pimeloyl-ACP methyl ester carboxylesterase
VADPARVPSLAHTVAGPLGRGEPVILLPAFPLERSLWVPVAERLAAASIASIAVDLPGLGGSPLPAGEPDLAISAEAVLALLDYLGVGRAVVAGVSMGGYVALAIARLAPDRLAAIALIDTRAEADGADARANRERVSAAVEGDAGTRALSPMLEGLLGVTSRRERPDVVRSVREALAAARTDGVAWSQRAMAARPDATAELAGLAVPAAVVVGAEDTLSPPDVARAMAGALPDAVLSVLPRAGHLTPVESPDGVAAALIALVLRVHGR